MAGLRKRTWKRFLRGPDPDLLEALYVPALSEAVRYDRCCAYFSSSVLAAAARGFGKLIERLDAMGDSAPHPAIRLVVNEELSADDVRALTETGDLSVLEAKLKKRFKHPTDALEKSRLKMLGWLVKAGLAEVRVGVMRRGNGIAHGKFGLMIDPSNDVLVFRGSSNESASALQANYENLEISSSWQDPEAIEYYAAEFAALWADEHPDVHTVSLPEALRLQLIRFAPRNAPTVEPTATTERDRAAMAWQFIAEALYLPNGAAACDGTAMVKPWPHQVHVISETANAWPDGRLLCDEVGMGKTVEAMLAIRRLLAGRGVRRILILPPANLVTQWQGELREKGGLLFPRYDASNKLIWPDGREETVPSLAGALGQDRLIMSRELARMEMHRGVLLGADPWDLVLLDESHAARRANQIEGEYNSGTLLLDLIRELQLRGKTRGFMLLSATPMQTSPWEPWDLLAILGEGRYWLADFTAIRDYYTALAALEHAHCDAATAGRAADVIEADSRFSPPAWHTDLDLTDHGAISTELLFAGMNADRVARWMRQNSPLHRRMHRNTRQTLHRYYQMGLLDSPPPIRKIRDVIFDYEYAGERRIYEQIKTYIDTRFEQLEHEQTGKGFVMTVYRRRAVSSPYALQRSLERRREGLQLVARRHAYEEYLTRDEEVDERDMADLGFEGQGRISSAYPTRPEDARRELEQVDEILHDLADLHGQDSKRERFLDELHRVTADGRAVLVFTEYTDTMEYLRTFLIDSYGERLGCYYGGGGEIWDGTRWKAVSKGEITAHLKDGKLSALICTDAASEGLNLQAAGAIINYDLPWNPSKVEQRIGRVDRIGQKLSEVEVVNLFLHHSVDEQVYLALRERCGLFEHFVGAMQPVLARARRILLGREQLQVGILEEEARRVDGDMLGQETYAVESEARAEAEPVAPVTRADLLNALKLIPHDTGIVIKRKGEHVEVHGGGMKRALLTAANADLEQYASVSPFTPDIEPVQKLAKVLSRTGARYPLVIGSHQQGAFRASVAYWLDGDLPVWIDSLAQVQEYLAAWDGENPDSRRWVEVQRMADQQARQRVNTLRAQAKQRECQNLEAQVEAARIRLLREIARFLLCLRPDSPDLNGFWYELMTRGGATGSRLSQALQRLGGEWPNWPSEWVADARTYVQTLPPSRVEARRTGREVDAALQDLRWKAVETLALIR